jgi:SAM-dependent methyltransferase
MELTNAIFDGAAKTYDADFSFTTIGKLQRQRVWSFIKNRFTNKTHTILEINCGTGEDAIWLANNGHRVIATDVSNVMITVCLGKKIINEARNVQFLNASYLDVHNKFPNQKFDFIFSNFGGLNCANKSDLSALSKSFSTMLCLNGKLLFVIMGRKCWIERTYFLLKGKIAEAKRRKSPNGVRTKIGDSIFFTYYYSPNEIKKIFADDFIVSFRKPIGITIPPSYLEKYFSNKKLLLSVLNKCESLFGCFPFLSNYADHYLIELTKR